MIKNMIILSIFFSSVPVTWPSARRDVNLIRAKMRKMMKQPAISQFIKKELAPGEDIEDEKSLEKEIRRNGATAYHQCASCAMGPEDDSVLNEKLQVRGIDKLRIADASVMPRIPNAALHAPSMMIGEKAAALIKGEFI